MIVVADNLVLFDSLDITIDLKATIGEVLIITIDNSEVLNNVCYIIAVKCDCNRWRHLLFVIVSETITFSLHKHAQETDGYAPFQRLQSVSK